MLNTSENKELVNKIISNPLFLQGIVLSLDYSIHGMKHWKRVEEFGLKIAEKNGADKKVVSLFAYLHDARRESEHSDPGHGLRAASLLDELVENKILNLELEQYKQLKRALSLHSQANAKSDDITVQTCWDADRLDLWRCDVVPSPMLMFTDCGKSSDMIEYAKKINNV